MSLYLAFHIAMDGIFTHYGPHDSRIACHLKLLHHNTAERPTPPSYLGKVVGMAPRPEHGAKQFVIELAFNIASQKLHNLIVISIQIRQ